MKRVSTILLACALWSATNAQLKPDVQQDGLLGSAQTVTTEVVELSMKDGKSVEGRRMPLQIVTYDARGNRLKRIDYHRDGSVAQTLVYTYDAEGRSTGYEDYTGDLKIPRKHVYVLDPKGVRVEYKIVQPDGAGGERYLYTYDPHGNKISEELRGHKGELISKTEYAYDEAGRLISQVMYNPDGSISSRSRNSNDTHGKPIERIRYEGDILTYKLSYSYDSKGRTAGVETVGSFVEGDASGSEAYATGKVVYRYKDKDQLKETLTYNPDGSLRERVVIVYDSNGNWIKRTHLVRDPLKGKEVPRQVDYRTITYHSPGTANVPPATSAGRRE